MESTNKTCDGELQSIVTAQVKELIAIGAAIACNCEMCFKFHFDKARKLGVYDEDMFAAVETGSMVKGASAQSIKDLAYKYLKKEAAKEPCCSGSCCQ